MVDDATSASAAWLRSAQVAVSARGDRGHGEDSHRGPGSHRRYGDAVGCWTKGMPVFWLLLGTQFAFADQSIRLSVRVDPPAATGLQALNSYTGSRQRSRPGSAGREATVRDYGASCDDTADDARSLAAMAAALGHIVIPEDCAVRIATATTIAVPTEVKAGGLIKADGVVVLLNGAVQAPASAAIFAFANDGSVKFGTRQDRYPEWFGAKANDPRFDNTASINASIAAGAGYVVFLGATYYHRGTLIDTTAKVHIVGRGDQSTIFLLQDGSADQFAFGVPVPDNATAPTSLPPLDNLYASLENVLLIRTVAPMVDIGDAPFAGAAKGVSITNATWVRIEKVHVYGSRIGLYRRHTANTASHDFSAEFDFASTFGGTEAVGGDFIGDLIDSQDSLYSSRGAVSQTANASTTDVDSLALCRGGAGATTSSVGYRIQGNFSDQWLVRPQTAGCNGLVVDGTLADVKNGGRVQTSSAKPYTSDVNISNMILDGFRDYGLRIVNIPSNISAISADNGYISNGYTAVGKNIDIENASGVSLTGGWTILGWVNSNPRSICLYTKNARQISVESGVALLSCHNPVYMDYTSGSEISPRIHNADTRAADNAAITLDGGSFNTIAPLIDSTTAAGAVSGAFRSAVLLIGGPTMSGNAVDLTKVLPYAFSGGHANIACREKYSTSTTTFTSVSVGAPFFGKRLCSGAVLITGSQP